MRPNAPCTNSCMPYHLSSSLDLETKPLKVPCHTFYLLRLTLLCSLRLFFFFFPPSRNACHFITLMYLVGFSRRSRPPVMQRQMLSVWHQLLLMFKVMQGDRLIKRRLRDALGLSLSRPAGLVTSGSRVLLPRLKGRRIKMFRQERRVSRAHVHIFHPRSP